MYNGSIGPNSTPIPQHQLPPNRSNETSRQEAMHPEPYVRVPTTDATETTSTQSHAERTSLVNELRSTRDAVLALQWRPIDEKTRSLQKLKDSNLLAKTSCSELVDLLLGEMLKGPNGNTYLRVLSGTLGQWADHYEQSGSDPARVDAEDPASPLRSVMYDDSSSVQPKDRAGRRTTVDSVQRDNVQASALVEDVADSSSEEDVDEANSATLAPRTSCSRRDPEIMDWLFDRLLQSPVRESVTELHRQALQQPFSAKVPKDIHVFGQYVTKVREWYVTGSSDHARTRVIDCIQSSIRKGGDDRSSLIAITKLLTNMHIHPSTPRSLFRAAREIISDKGTVDSLNPAALMARMNMEDKQIAMTFFTKDEHHLGGTQQRKLPPSASLPHWTRTDADGSGNVASNAASSSSLEVQPLDPSSEVLTSKRKLSEADEKADEKPTADVLQESLKAFAASRPFSADSETAENAIAEPAHPHDTGYWASLFERQPIRVLPGSRHFAMASVPEHLLRQGMPFPTATVSTQTDATDPPQAPRWAAVPDMTALAATASTMQLDPNPLLQEPEHAEDSR